MPAMYIPVEILPPVTPRTAESPFRRRVAVDASSTANVPIDSERRPTRWSVHWLRMKAFRQPARQISMRTAKPRPPALEAPRCDRPCVRVRSPGAARTCPQRALAAARWQRCDRWRKWTTRLAWTRSLLLPLPGARPVDDERSALRLRVVVVSQQTHMVRGVRAPTSIQLGENPLDLSLIHI